MAQAPMRVAVTGRAVGPPLFESLEVLGRERHARSPAGGPRASSDADSPWRRASPRSSAVIVIAVAVVYFGVTFVQVWLASRRDEARPAQAIVVFGAAQYNGRPSPVLRARLDHAAELWRRKLAPYVVVTGGKPAGRPLHRGHRGGRLPARAWRARRVILREVQRRDSWESLAAAAASSGVGTSTTCCWCPIRSTPLRIKAHGRRARSSTAYTSPTRTSPINGRDGAASLRAGRPSSVASRHASSATAGSCGVDRAVRPAA